MCLPNSDYTGCDEEEIAYALGCVCHYLQMISRILQVPLRYPVVAMASRSYIIDEVSNRRPSRPAMPTRFPLFPTNDRTRFSVRVPCPCFLS